MLLVRFVSENLIDQIKTSENQSKLIQFAPSFCQLSINLYSITNQGKTKEGETTHLNLSFDIQLQIETYNSNTYPLTKDENL